MTNELVDHIVVEIMYLAGVSVEVYTIIIVYRIDNNLHFRGSTAPIIVIWILMTIKCFKGAVLPSNVARWRSIKFSWTGDPMSLNTKVGSRTTPRYRVYLSHFFTVLDSSLQIFILVTQFIFNGLNCALWLIILEGISASHHLCQLILCAREFSLPLRVLKVFVRTH